MREIYAIISDFGDVGPDLRVIAYFGTSGDAAQTMKEFGMPRDAQIRKVTVFESYEEYVEFKKMELRNSGLQKLTQAEKIALGLTSSK